MITREEIRQLAQFESPTGCAISFYFQPQTPQNKSHREEAILIKDLVRDVLRKAERNGNDAAMRQDLEKVLEIAEARQSFPRQSDFCLSRAGHLA
jgi:hypothetical protein